MHFEPRRRNNVPGESSKDIRDFGHVVVLLLNHLEVVVEGSNMHTERRASTVISKLVKQVAL